MELRVKIFYKGNRQLELKKSEAYIKKLILGELHAKIGMADIGFIKSLGLLNIVVSLNTKQVNKVHMGQLTPAVFGVYFYVEVFSKIDGHWEVLHTTTDTLEVTNKIKLGDKEVKALFVRYSSGLAIASREVILRFIKEFNDG